MIQFTCLLPSLKHDKGVILTIIITLYILRIRYMPRRINALFRKIHREYYVKIQQQIKRTNLEIKIIKKF